MRLAGIVGSRGIAMSELLRKAAVWGGFVVSVACIALVFKSVPVRDFWEALQRIHWLWIVPSFVIFYAGLYFRGLRWRWLLGESERKHSTELLFEGILVGYAFNNILPSGRVGEFARALYVSKNRALTFPFVFGTIVNDRLFDSLIVLLLVGLTAFWVLPIAPEIEVEFGGFELSAEVLNPLFVNVALGSLSVVAMVLALLVPPVARFIQGVVGRLPFLSDSVRNRLLGVVVGMFEGLNAVKSGRSLVWVSVYTFLIWGVNAVAAYTLAWAIPGLTISPFQAIGLMAIVTVCAVIPAAPGFWGLYEAGMIVGFQVLEIHEENAVALAFGVTMHLIYYLPTTGLGLLFAFRSAIGFGTLSEINELESAKNCEETERSA